MTKRDLIADNERLRDALRQIADGEFVTEVIGEGPASPPILLDDWSSLKHVRYVRRLSAREIARKALA